MPILTIEPYPCYWPESWPRSKSRRSSNYKATTVMRTRDDIVKRLKLMDATEFVVSTNIAVRRDGLPLAGMSNPADPSVAVYWVERGPWNEQERRNVPRIRVVACDQWNTVGENLRAVNVTLDALHQIIRSGSAQLIERAMTGLALAAENPR